MMLGSVWLYKKNKQSYKTGVKTPFTMFKGVQELKTSLEILKVAMNIENHSWKFRKDKNIQ